METMTLTPSKRTTDQQHQQEDQQEDHQSSPVSTTDLIKFIVLLRRKYPSLNNSNKCQELDDIKRVILWLDEKSLAFNKNKEVKGFFNHARLSLQLVLESDQKKSLDKKDLRLYMFQTIRFLFQNILVEPPSSTTKRIDINSTTTSNG
jgi:hypothetical protein